MSLNAYQRARSIVENPRATEFRLMSQITGDMMQARDEGLSGAGLVPVLHRNREIWGVFSSACGAPGNELPDQLRAAIISIALWVDRFTSDVIAGRESIDELIEVNRSITEGLSPGTQQYRMARQAEAA
ncbi:flagellar biosynthesis regulator FlaF [Sphingomonas sp. IC-11]|uniref:flagellar biosynthesis regulator FlaF n=1 Tax=Sphingomonas sp. IC-11 TaxID=2898528 RepID=UPI001E56F78F|nr:flagellar biosynthesis regulator FlaF [Sphingomonas sp. IC-11]MCD2317066.1 flagellar biosynthesis regulator FlaF [Sphingomonas sp. IC-11]